MHWHLRLVLQNRCQPKFYPQCTYVELIRFSILRWNSSETLVWLDEWQKSSTFSLPYDEEKDCLGRSKTHQSCNFSPPVSFSSSSLWQLSPPCLPHTLPCQKCSSSIHPPFLSQCNVNVGGWRCDALIILQKVFRCGRQSRLMKQSCQWDRLWSEVEIQSLNNWSKVQHFESSDPERLKNWGIMKQDLNKVGLFDKVSTILK